MNGADAGTPRADTGDESLPRTVELVFDRHGGYTRAEARLSWRGRTTAGVGFTRLRPGDRSLAEVGDELAVARALADLANRLESVTARDMDRLPGTP
ncbi:DUF1876 family protein [Mycolicibacterium fluoranthenivorans]|jgi:hypothetical protein|uniref:DUF1876 family protein n=1 Tax=Mycolicibacterium fluoranthenivorans TaxID=258505 RepID=A0A7G8P993_9MYCO|nr:dsRBD fold-containing protein [Mycolicibacterium fluoranthenivorans]QNJ90909.1 DUF1876 family protein [Mycolicibacterium fluoranthenivorans]